MDTRQSSNITNEENVANLQNKYTADELTSAINSGALAHILQNPAIDTVLFENNSLHALDNDTLKKFSALFQGTNIKKLYLGNNGLGQLDARKITALLVELKTSPITELHLNNNSLWELGTRNFGLLMQYVSQTSITTLNLGNNALYKLGKPGLAILDKFIAESRIQTLAISDNDFELFLPKTYLDKAIKLYEEHFNSAANNELIEKLTISARNYAQKIENAHLQKNTVQKEKDSLNQLNPYAKSHNTLMESITKNNILSAFSSLIKNIIKHNALNNYQPTINEGSLFVEAALKNLNKTLMKNEIKYNNNVSSLKMLTMFSILHKSDIKWKEANIPTDLKDEMNYHSLSYQSKR